jgi:hypothetical protein
MLNFLIAVEPFWSMYGRNHGIPTQLQDLENATAILLRGSSPVQPTLRSRTRNDCATSGRYEAKYSCGRIDKRSKMSLGLKEYALTS